MRGSRRIAIRRALRRRLLNADRARVRLHRSRTDTAVFERRFCIAPECVVPDLSDKSRFCAELCRGGCDIYRSSSGIFFKQRSAVLRLACRRKVDQYFPDRRNIEFFHNFSHRVKQRCVFGFFSVGRSALHFM